MNKIFLLMAFLWSAVLSAQETRYLLTHRYSASIGFGTPNGSPYDRNYLDTTEEDEEVLSSPSSFELSFSFYLPQKHSLLLTITPRLGKKDASGFTDRDKDILDANNSTVRLVSRLEDLDTYDLGVEGMLGRPFSLGIFLVIPSVGVGFDLGQDTMTQEWMTDRANPVLFSKHNRYKLTSERSFLQYSGLAHLLLNVERWNIYFKYRYSWLSTVGKIEQKFDFQGDEAFAYSDKDFQYAGTDRSSISEFFFGVGFCF